MLNDKKYVTLSLELHLFFGRIMKEHAIFLEAGFTPKNSKFAKEAESFKNHFEKFLLEVVKLADGRIRSSVVESGEFFTEYTANAEKKTQFYTGININSKITSMEENFSNITKNIDGKTVKSVRQINEKAKKLLKELIEFKEKVLNDVLACKMFTLNYPLFNEHLVHEAKLYLSYVELLEEDNDIDFDCGYKKIMEKELFWDDIMMEHAWFIRGLLDPSEAELIGTANQFAEEYSELIKKAASMNEKTMAGITDVTLMETIKFRDFKTSGVEGILGCKIKSIILPLIADHVLREANHYIRLLNSYNKKEAE